MASMTLGGHLRIDAVQKYVAGTLSGEERGALNRHLEACDECRALLVAASSTVARPRLDEAGPAELPTIPEEHYLIEREIARGGLGKILSARHIPLDRVVAVKELIASSPGDREQQQRFVREALVTAGLQHPSIVPVHEAGRWPSGEPFYAMKLVVGQSLQRILEDAAGLDARLALLPRLIAVGEALAYAHARGVIHRDIKPGNILCGEFGETVLIDWGLAKRVADDDAGGGSRSGESPLLTAEGVVMGTPRYMSPEQADGRPADERSDVYSLGVVLYEMLTGASPYADPKTGLAGVGVAELAAFIREGKVTPVRAREPEAPRDLVTITERALALDPARRYPSAKAFVDDLGRYTTGQLISRRYSAGELARRWLRRRAGAVAVAATALVALAAVGAVSALRVARARAEAQASLARLELDEGRQAYLGGDPLLALAFLAAALRDGADGPIARYLLARAGEAVSAQRLVIAAHDGGAYTVRYRPDGKLLASGGEDGAAIWDAESGALRHRLPGHQGAVLAAEWAPDGARLVTAGLDGVVRVWDPDSGALVKALEGHRGYVPGVRFAPDGKTLASWDLFGGLRLWDTASWSERAAISAHAGRLAEAAFDPGGTRVLTVGRDAVARLWSAADGTPICASEPEADALVSAAFAPDGTRFAAGRADSQAAIFDAATCRLTLRISAAVNEISAVRFDPLGGRLLTAGLGATRLWDAGDGALRQTLEEHFATQVAVFSGDGRRIASGGHDRQVHVFSAADGRPLARFAGHAANVRALAWSPDQRRLASASADGTVRVWQVAGDPLGRAPSGLRTLLPEDDGRILVVTNNRGDVLRFDPAGGAFTPVAAGVCPWSASRTQAANLVCVPVPGAILRARDGVAELVELPGGAARWRDPSPAVTAAALGGSLAATATARGDVRVAEAATGAEVRALHLGQRIAALALLPDERLVTVSSAAIGVWNARSGAPLLTLPGAPLPRDLAALPLAASRGWILVPATDREAEVVDLQGGKVLVTLQGQRGAVHGAVFSRDGSRVATRHMDNVVRLWDATTGVLLDVLPYGALGDQAFAPDGERLLTVDEAGELQAWPLGADRRSLAEIERFVDRCVPYRVERGTVLARAGKQDCP